ncbi:right-handed parallel beta-helix repeat-containing protein [Patescibacteria group bacterium]|nr:right-handed parallel beta-helix repeat-containing protein [Patescibacteria group bacterium]
MNRTYYLLFLLSLFGGSFGNALMAQPLAEVGGVLVTDRFFSRDTTYIIVEDLKVTQGAQLSIEAGTSLRFNQGKGLLVDGGKLEAIGISNEQVDSILFVPNYINPAQGWKWKGITIFNASASNPTTLSYVVVTDAEEAVKLINSSNVIMEHSCFINNFWRGISIQNSHDVLLRNSQIYNNYVGVEILAKGAFGLTFDNIVQGNVMRNETTNIFIINETGGSSYRNQIIENVVQNGINGIWIDNSGLSGSRGNTIARNAIINNGDGFGYGLYLAMDSTTVRRNIFWRNASAVWFRNSSNNLIENNSFYENGNALPVRAGSKRNTIKENTFSLNERTVVTLDEPIGNVLLQNNFIHCFSDTLVELMTTQNMNATGNYWGSVTETEIAERIIDVHDNAELGELFFIPFLTTADSTAPLAPPFNVKKQWVKDRVRLSWQPNEEEDIYGYKVYYQHFTNYQFENSIAEVQDTVIFLSRLAITDTIAVTATDRISMDFQDKFLGYESPYALAQAAPYAGSDTSICKNEVFFAINDANAPFDYHQSRWSSSGDGSFTEPNQLQTSYFPGASDYETGEVKLTLMITTADEVFFESFKLAFSEDPLAFAGNDTIIGRDSTLLLNTASASYFTSINWQTTGDGAFLSSNEINTYYIPGELDKVNGEVSLILEASSECGYHADTLRLLLLDEYSLEGSVWFDNQAISNASVLAFRYSEDGFNPLSKVQSSLSGAFRFEKLFTGNYVIMALPDTIRTGRSLAYYAERSHWEKAHRIALIEPAYDVDIHLEKTLSGFPSGNAVINGHFELPENGFRELGTFCSDWFSRDGSLQYCDGGLSNISITLYDTDLTTLLAYTLTDYQGKFYFDSLAYGNYRLHAEIPGYPLNLSPVIQLSPEQVSTEAVFQIENQKISISAKGEQLVFEPESRIYPNPVNDYLFIEIQDIQTLMVYDLFGVLVHAADLTKHKAGHHAYKLDMRKFKNGVYILVLASEQQLISRKVVKQ